MSLAQDSGSPVNKLVEEARRLVAQTNKLHIFNRGHGRKSGAAAEHLFHRTEESEKQASYSLLVFSAIHATEKKLLNNQIVLLRN